MQTVIRGVVIACLPDAAAGRASGPAARLATEPDRLQDHYANVRTRVTAAATFATTATNTATVTIVKRAVTIWCPFAVALSMDAL